MTMGPVGERFAENATSVRSKESVRSEADTCLLLT